MIIVPRIIKKYPNRRLYDTTASSYITLDDVRQLVLSRTPFQVVDSRTGEEITRAILLQIISELEEGGAPLFSVQLLANLICFYDASMGMNRLLADFLDQSFDLFQAHQQQARRELDGDQANLPDLLSLMQRMAAQNFETWQKWQKSWIATPPAPSGGGSSKKS